MGICLTAAYPWNSIYAPKQKPEHLRKESEQEIKKCLDCKKSDCDNCLAAFDKKYGRGRKFTTEELRLFLRVNDEKTACKHFGCNRSTIWRRLKEIDERKD